MPGSCRPAFPQAQHDAAGRGRLTYGGREMQTQGAKPITQYGKTLTAKGLFEIKLNI